ncbi:hypothetical protein CCP3SC1AL1_1110003 [Gammaproteobacteria bacterium]
MKSLTELYFKDTFNRLFGTDPHQLVRLNDPSTSHEAAQAVDTTKLEQMVYEAIKSFPDGCISDQILEMYPNYPYSSITARYRALLDKGFIEITGVKRGKFGRNQRVMKAVC